MVFTSLVQAEQIVSKKLTWLEAEKEKARVEMIAAIEANQKRAAANARLKSAPRQGDSFFLGGCI